MNPALIGENNGRYAIIKLHTSFNMLPGCRDLAIPGSNLIQNNDFQGLFSQYKITALNTTITPNFNSGNTFNSKGIEIPNMEMFILKSTIVDEGQLKLEDMKSQQLDAFLASKNTKGKRILPASAQYFKCNNPKVCKYGSLVFKQQEHGVSTQYMGSPEWYSTSSSVAPSGGVDETSIQHYSFALVIRRVDGQPFAQMNDISIHNFGFRIENKVNWTCRSTVRDILESTDIK